jgi:hypothetical protein
MRTKPKHIRDDLQESRRIDSMSPKREAMGHFRKVAENILKKRGDRTFQEGCGEFSRGCEQQAW